MIAHFKIVTRYDYIMVLYERMDEGWYEIIRSPSWPVIEYAMQTTIKHKSEQVTCYYDEKGNPCIK